MGKLTRTDQVLEVLKAGGSVRTRRDGILILLDRNHVEVAAWQQAIKAAQRIHGKAQPPAPGAGQS